MKKILLVYPARSSFVRADIDILHHDFHVVEYLYPLDKRPLMFVYQFVKQFFYLLLHAHKFDILYIWFADYHSFLPVVISKIFRRRSVIVLGGYDTTAIPTIEYGIFLKRNTRRLLAAFAIRHADTLLGVDETMFEGVNRYVSPEGIKVGVKNFVSTLRGKCYVVPTGYDPEFWKRAEGKKENLVLTIGACQDERTFKRKGLDMFIELASRMAHVSFVIVGLAAHLRKEITSSMPANLTVYDFLPQKELLKLASRAKVFCQFSMAEGLPNTLCECMLCECIPVGSTVNGIPKAIHDPALLIQHHMDIDDAVQKVTYALSLPETSGLIFRERIITLFPQLKRKNDLIKILSDQF